MCQVNLVRLQNGGGFNSDEGTITVCTVGYNFFLKKGKKYQFSLFSCLRQHITFFPEINCFSTWE